MTRRAYQSIIGRPYYWQGRGKWWCRYRGFVFVVPKPGLSREAVNALADKAQAAMLARNLALARRKR